MPLDIQWFIFALVSNGAIGSGEAFAIYASLGEPDLTAYAQAILDRLAEGLDETDQQSLLEQIQQVIDYAVEQAETGIAPEIPQDEPALAAGSGIQTDNAIHYDGIDFDLSQVQSYADLPSLRDISLLDDQQVAERMIILLSCLRALGCSDLHLSAGSPPFARRMLAVERFDDFILPADDALRLNTVLLDQARREQFLREQDMNLALEIGPSRFRVCLMIQKDGAAGSYRLVPDHICELEELGFMPEDVITIKRMLDYHNGLVLVTGPIGSGKTTTLASMVNIINEKRQDHIISVEDPIEILQFSKNCQVTQREIGRHTNSYRSALKAALREDPDVIVIGEMHDLETIENAITASETGHLVIGTLHTSDAANTMNRLLDVFPPSQQPQIRAMTAGSLRGVICQKLIPAANGGLTNAYEILVNTLAVANIITEGKSYRLKSTMSTGSKQGMCTIDQCLLEKFKQGVVDYETALPMMRDQSEIKQLQSEYAVREAKKLKKGR